MVDLQVHRVLAELTAPGKEPVDQLVAPGAGHDRPLVGEDGCAYASERDPAEAGDQWFPPPVAFHGDLQAPAGSGGCLDCGLVLPSHRGDRRTVLACQRLEQRGLHDPVEAAQAEHVLGQKVVLDKTGVLGLILRDDGEIVVVKQRATLRWFSFAHVKRAPLPDEGPGHEQPDRSVDRPAVAGDLGVGVLGTDLVAEEARRLAGSVRDQRLGLRQLQLEFLAQERRDLRLDVLGLALWTGEPQQPVVGIADIPEPPVARISGVLARELAAAQGGRRGCTRAAAVARRTDRAGQGRCWKGRAMRSRPAGSR